MLEQKAKGGPFSGLTYERWKEDSHCPASLQLLLPDVSGLPTNGTLGHHRPGCFNWRDLRRGRESHLMFNEE